MTWTVETLNDVVDRELRALPLTCGHGAYACAS